MSGQELKVGVGLTRMRVNDAHDAESHVVFTVEPVRGGGESLMAMLDRSGQHFLYLYLQERLGLK